MDSTAKAEFVVSSLRYEKILIYVTEMPVARERQSQRLLRSFLLLHYYIVDRPGEVSGEHLATSIWRYVRTSVPS